MLKDPQQTWKEYYTDIKSRRSKEAKAIWFKMASEGVTEDSILALDFKLFSSDKKNAESLEEQLKENYKIAIEQSDKPDYWIITGTTRPYGIDLSEDAHLNWVEFMCDVAQSHGCVFSTWDIEEPKSSSKWSSKND